MRLKGCEKTTHGIFLQEICTPGLNNCTNLVINDEECQEIPVTTMQVQELPDSIKTKIGAGLLEMAERWSGIKLELSSVYGIRRYLRGSYLGTHVDKTSKSKIETVRNE